MAILHLNWIPRPGAWRGLIRKLGEQAHAAREAGLPLTVAVVAREPQGDDGTGLRWLQAKDGRLPMPLAERVSRIDCLMRAAGTGWDAVVLRYPGASDLTPPAVLRRWPKLITEHHTDMIAELRLLARGPAGRLKLMAERLNGRRLLSQVDGLVGVTEEIRAREAARGGVRRSIAIGNGFDCMSAPAIPIPRWDGGALHILFAAAGFAAWHGLDRLLAGLARHRGAPVVVHLAGRVDSVEDLAAMERLDPAHASVERHGTLDATALRGLAGRCHVAVSSLAIHRAGLAEACPLKTREYLAWGMPTILGYRDTDLADPVPGVCVMPSGDVPVDIEEVLAVARDVAARHEAVVDGLRSLARRRLDWRPKLERLVHFVRSL